MHIPKSIKFMKNQTPTNPSKSPKPSIKSIAYARELDKEKDGLIACLTKEKDLIILGKGDNSKIATEVGKEWFEDSVMGIEDYKNTIVHHCDHDLVAKINSDERYKSQLLALEKEKVHIKETLTKIAKDDSMDDSLGLEIDEDLI
jgi:hypothetical protein